MGAGIATAVATPYGLAARPIRYSSDAAFQVAPPDSRSAGERTPCCPPGMPPSVHTLYGCSFIAIVTLPNTIHLSSVSAHAGKQGTDATLPEIVFNDAEKGGLRCR